MGRPWTDDEEKVTHFRLKDLEAYLTRNKFMALSAGKIATRLRQIGGSPTSFFIKGRAVRLWKIPAFEKQSAPFEVKNKNQEDVF
jgi:hypothetical protein